MIVVVRVLRYNEDPKAARVGLLTSPEFRDIAPKALKRSERTVEGWIDILRSPGLVEVSLKVSESSLKRSRLLKRECFENGDTPCHV